jgi:hypothetical protein
VINVGVPGPESEIRTAPTIKSSPAFTDKVDFLTDSVTLIYGSSVCFHGCAIVIYYSFILVIKNYPTSII